MFKLLMFLVLCALSQSCVRYVDEETGRPLAGPYNPYPAQNGGYAGSAKQKGGKRHLDSFDVDRVHFQARVDSNHADRQLEVSEYASAHFEQNNGQIITDDQLTKHFGFECHIRQVGKIQSVKIKPDAAPANIRAKFSN